MLLGSLGENQRVKNTNPTFLELIICHADARPLVSGHGVIPIRDFMKPGFALDLERKVKSNICYSY